MDKKYTAEVSKFQQKSTVSTLGGDNLEIKSKEGFDAWLKSLNGQPAIIHMTDVVPLWQLLDPGKARDSLKDATLAYARRFQAGALYGSLQLLNNHTSNQPWKLGTATGSTAIGRTITLAQASCYTEEWSQGNSELRLSLSTGMEKSKGSRTSHLRRTPDAFKLRQLRGQEGD